MKNRIGFEKITWTVLKKVLLKTVETSLKGFDASLKNLNSQPKILVDDFVKATAQLPMMLFFDEFYNEAFKDYIIFNGIRLENSEMSK